jgi:hypothetical protein
MEDLLAEKSDEMRDLKFSNETFLVEQSKVIDKIDSIDWSFM